ncbi:hypothetical protein AVEN_119351-1 [Araneus ventricosus]|uniref:Uncharacterized protein n=1 Tax=Araneus ventricosus TaxID=182803 RepID=A0A4Y2PZ25_ARAVE|nr:hypothetical protein AVEN_119351-1 [Araneus ventricosus]
MVEQGIGRPGNRLQVGGGLRTNSGGQSGVRPVSSRVRPHHCTWVGTPDAPKRAGFGSSVGFPRTATSPSCRFAGQAGGLLGVFWA